MTRKMRPAPEDILLAKTTRGTWIACEEVWEDGQLVALRPMRRDPKGGIVQARERREILAEIERAVLNTRLRQAERRLTEMTTELERGPGPARGRYAATG